MIYNGRNRKVRLNVTITNQANEIIKLVKKQNPNINVSMLISELIIQKLSNPKEILQKEFKHYAMKCNEIQEKLKILEELDK